MTPIADAPPHFVYEAFDIAGDPLYVGVTCEPDKRLAQHKSSRWWKLTAFVQRIGPLPMVEAYALERSRVAMLKPWFNKQPGGSISWEGWRLPIPHLVKFPRDLMTEIDRLRNRWTKADYIRHATADWVKRGKQGPTEDEL